MVTVFLDRKSAGGGIEVTTVMSEAHCKTQDDRVEPFRTIAVEC
jgi:hypothetical protein